jgi:class 3 adenylate cyclase
MDADTVYVRTRKGEEALKDAHLSLEMHDILSGIDGKTSVSQLAVSSSFLSREAVDAAIRDFLEKTYIEPYSETVPGEPIPDARAAELTEEKLEAEAPARNVGKSKFSQSERTLIASVLFLDIVEYTKKPVSEQFRIKEAFNKLVYELVQTIPEDDRIIIDTGDGAALGFLADPEAVLAIAIRLRDALEANGHADYPGLYVRQGINLGPIRLVADMNGRENLIGDGVNDANRIMGFAKGDQVLASRSFYDVASRLSSEHARLFKYQGIHKDKHGREHEVYEVMGGNRAAEEARKQQKTEEEIRAERMAKMKEKLEAAAKMEAAAKAAKDARESTQAEARQQAEMKRAAEEKPKTFKPKKKGAGKTIAALFIVLVALLLGALPFVPLGFLARSESDSISLRTGKTVSIGSAYVSLLPTPRIVLKDVSAGGIKVEKMTEDLFGDKAVVIHGVKADQDTLSALSSWKSIAGIMQLEQVSLSLDGKQLPFFDGQIETGPGGSFGHARIESDGMSADITPVDSGFRIEIAAKRWAFPMGPSCPWDELNASAIEKDGQIDISSFKATGYGGSVSGSGSISWNQGWRAALRFKGSELEIDQLLPYFSQDAKLSGWLKFDAAASMASTSLSTLFDSPSINAVFGLHDGKVPVDFAQAIRVPSPDGTRGGETKYDTLSGNLALVGGEYRYSGLKLNSGMMNVAGNLVVKGGNLSGTAEVSLAQIRSALTLSGSLPSPVIR